MMVFGKNVSGSNPLENMTYPLFSSPTFYMSGAVCADQGGRCCVSVRAALTERSGSSTKGRTPNIRYFVAKPSIVAIYALFERLSQGFQRKPSCFHRAYYESHLAFEELSTKAILLS